MTVPTLVARTLRGQRQPSSVVGSVLYGAGTDAERRQGAPGSARRRRHIGPTVDVAGREPVVVAFQLGVRGFEQVDTEDVGETHDVDGHVGEFVADVVGPGGSHDVDGLCWG